MPTQILLVLAALLLAMQRQDRATSAAQQLPQAPSTHDDLRFQVTYFQQFVSVQAAQTGAIEAKCAVLLTLDALLFQYIATPIVNPFLHWSVFGLFAIVAFLLLFIIVMQRVEIMTSKDPLMKRDPAVLDVDTLRKTHRALHAMLVDNERRLTAREVGIRWVLAVGVFATVLGLTVNDRQPTQPQPVIIVTPAPSVTPSPSPTPPRGGGTPNGRGTRPSPPKRSTRPTPTKRALQQRGAGVVSSTGRTNQ